MTQVAPSAFGALGDVVASADVPASAFARALAGRACVALAPSDERGWFEGTAVVAWDPSFHRKSVNERAAGDLLSQAFDGERAGITIALVSYEGVADVLHFDGGLALAPDGWRRFGVPPLDVDAVASAAEKYAGIPTHHPREAPLLAGARWNMSGEQYRQAVSKVRERIAAGDVYVLNLTMRLSGAPVLSPADSFECLLARASSSMNAFVGGLGDGAGWLASVSPERFMRVSDEEGRRLAEICPIKGTCARGVNDERDAVAAARLLHDPKERAEHLMVVDLERNDLGRVSEAGSIEVAALYEVTATPYCHQLVSAVRGRLRADVGFAQVLEATFPCGSVTGAPKIAAIRIADEYEGGPRGAYCGSLLVAAKGSLDSSVVIRSLEGDEHSASWGAGCGITYESSPAAEHLEVLLKASPVTGDEWPSVALRETMRAAFGVAPLLDRHLARLASGGCGPTLIAKVRASIEVALATVDSEPYARVGVTVTPDGEVSAGANLEHSSLDVAGGPRLAVVRVSDLPALPLAAAKPAARRYWDRAHHKAALSGADQAVLISSDGLLIDGSTSTVWLVIDGQLVTSPAPPAIAGVARGVVFDLAASLGLPALQRQIAEAEIESADEVFLSNGVGWLAPVRGRGGPIYEKIASEWEKQVGYWRGDSGSDLLG